MLVSVVIIQILLILLIRFWPVYETSDEFSFDEPPQQPVLIDEIEITRQQTSPPPPPKPQFPNPQPTDEIIDVEFEIDADMDLPEMPKLEPGFGSGTSGDEEQIVSNPQIPPTVVRIVEATAPQSVPEEYKGNLEMIVNFLVDSNGEVEEVSILEIRLYSSSGDEYETLPFVQYGLMDTVLKAAMQWRFRPARQDGEPVKAFTRQRFNY